MACFETGTIIDLASREAFSLDDARGVTLRITRGTVWITQEGDLEDIVLRSGDNWVIECNGRTVIEAQEDASVCAVGRQLLDAGMAGLQPARTPAWQQRLAQFFTRSERTFTPYA